MAYSCLTFGHHTIVAFKGWQEPAVVLLDQQDSGFQVPESVLHKSNSQSGLHHLKSPYCWGVAEAEHKGNQHTAQVRDTYPPV